MVTAVAKEANRIIQRRRNGEVKLPATYTLPSVEAATVRVGMKLRMQALTDFRSIKPHIQAGKVAI
jgi:hypothetical protein